MSPPGSNGEGKWQLRLLHGDQAVGGPSEAGSLPASHSAVDACERAAWLLLPRGPCPLLPGRSHVIFMSQLANPEDTGQGVSFQGLIKTAGENALPSGGIADTRWPALGVLGPAGGGGRAACSRHTPAGFLSLPCHSKAPPPPPRSSFRA